MWNMSIAWWEFVLRGIIIYVFLIILLRVTGKRQIGQMSPFDLVLLLVLSNAVQNSINWLVGSLTYKSGRAEALIEGRPELLIHNGKLFEKALAKCQLTRDELGTALRESGCSEVKDVQAAFLENNGTISVIPKSK